MKKLLTTSAILLCASLGWAQVVINEYSCANLSQFADTYGKHEDWIELYNGNGTSLNLGGYYLSDDTTNLTQWRIPNNTTILAGATKIFFASGRNTGSHTNFKLSQTKTNAEVLCLSSATGVLIDKIKINKTQLGHSRGRTTNGAAAWGIFRTPTPNASNNTQTAYTAYADRPSFSQTPGFYTSAITVTITNNEPNSVVRYTLDGTEPTQTSAIYSTPLSIATTKVLKARAFSTNSSVISGFLEYATYFINVSHTLNVVSISGTQLQTLANGDGSLRPFGSIEYFDKMGVRKAKSYGEYNQHGQDSWANDQRSVDFVARDEMGYSAYLKEKLFHLTDRDKFQRIILRAAGDDNYPSANRASNAGSAHVRDAYVQNLAKESGLKLDVRAAEKCIVYINGSYWGVYDIREIPDEHDYTEYNYGQGKYDLQYILTWGNTWAEYGGNQALTDWDNLRTYAMTHSMTDPTHYKYVINRLDAESLADYVIVNSMTICSDWLNYNTGWWRGMNPNGTHKRWGYILWDNDAVFDFYINYTGVPSTAFNAPVCQAQTLTSTSSDPEQHIALLNKLRTNPEFDHYYTSRYIDLMNTTFSCGNMLKHLDSIVTIIQPEMQQHATRWFGTYSGWWSNVQTLRTFILNRCNAIPSTINSCYGLTGPYHMYFMVDSANVNHRIKINSLTIDKFPFDGDYYNGIDIKLTGYTSDSLYKFKKWSSQYVNFSPYDSLALVTTTAYQLDTITAHFVPKLPRNNVASQDLNQDQIWLSAAPNLFGSSTTLSYYLPEATPVQLTIYNAIGTTITELSSQNQKQQSGEYTLTLNFKNHGLAAGLYFVQVATPKGKKTVKLIYTPN